MDVKRLFYVFLAVCFSFSFQSCGHDEDEDGVADDKDQCPHTAIGVKVDKTGCEVKREISQINFYLETSSSMAGYMASGSEFNRDVPAFVIGLENQIEAEKLKTKISLFNIADKVTNMQGGGQGLNNSIARINIANNPSSPMDYIFETITRDLDTSKIAILVSDCILSGTNDDISKSANRSFNKDNVATTLRNNIFKTFGSIKNKGFAVEVFGMKSSFHGKYYNYKNEVLENKKDGFADRPYYIWVIGHKNLLPKFDELVSSLSQFNPDLSLDFGKAREPITNFSIPYNKHLTPQKAKVKNHEISGFKIPANGPSTFAIVADLSRLPLYAQSVDFLKSNLTFEGAEGKFKVIDVREKQEINSTDLADKQVYKKPHIIIIAVNELVKSESNLIVKLPNNENKIYLDWSTMDDLTMDKVGHTTFGFQHFIEGVADAFGGSKQKSDLLKYSITLKK